MSAAGRSPRWIEPVELAGRHVRLTPLCPDDLADVARAVEDGRLYELWYTSVPRPDEVEAWYATAIRQRDDEGALPFAIRDSAGRLVGATRYFNVSPAVRRLEIGHTWYAASVQRSAINTESKLLLLGHAFEQLGCLAVELRTHFMNQASRRAIERLGARLDGILRHHRIDRNGDVGDSCVYSILAAEWPAVRSNLRLRLARPGGDRRDDAAARPGG